MSADEITDRVRQHVTARTDLLRYRYQKPAELELKRAARVPHFFFAPEHVDELCSILKQRLPQQASEIVRRAEKICAHKFDLLGYENLDYGQQINWHCDLVHGKIAPRNPWFKVRYLDFAEVGDSKVTWELNRHQHLVTLAKAYRLTGDEKFSAQLFGQWQHWHAENPYPIGINWASSLEVAFRSLSWIWVYFLLSGSPGLPRTFRSEWLKALHTSGRHIETYLSTYFSANTHLLGEAVALFFIGAVCPELPLSDQWKKRGWEIAVREARKQVQADGFHFEQSTYYHVYALDFLLHSALLATANDIALPKDFERTLENMLNALLLLGRAGAPPRMGDDDGGRLFDPRRNRSEHLLDPLAAGAVLFGRGDFKAVAGGLREETIWLLGEAGVAEFDRLEEKGPTVDSVALQASGLYLMAGEAGRQIVVDAGPQGAATAGHGHADALGIVLHDNRTNLLLDSGTGEYVGLEGDRDLFRGTAAHNTLTVDGLPQAEPRGPFGWVKLPNVKAEGWISGHKFDLFVGSHDGYTRLPSPVIHRRWVFSLKSGLCFVRDLAEGTGKHQLDIFWHIPAEYSAGGRDADTFLDRSGRNGISIQSPRGHGWSHHIRKDWSSPVYGCKERHNVLHFGTVASLPAEFVTLLMPVSDSKVVEADFSRVPDARGATAYRLAHSKEENWLCFSSQRSAWTVGAWHSDAEFFYCGGSRERQLLICCNGSYVENGGKKVISSSHRMLRCEIIIEEEQVNVFSSDESVGVNKQTLRELLKSPEAKTAISDPSKVGA
jgi:hypothetical protein